MTLTCFHLETLQVWITLIVSIEDNCCPRLVSIKLLYVENVVFVMVGGIEVSGVEFSILKYYENTILIRELSEIATMVFIVDTVNIWVEPYLTSTQCRMSVALERDTMDTLFGQQITLCSTPLDEDASKVTLHKDILLLLVWVRVESDLYQLRLTIRVGCEVVNL